MFQMQQQDFTTTQVGSDHHANDDDHLCRCSIRSLGSGMYESDGSISFMTSSMTTDIEVEGGEMRCSSSSRNYQTNVSAPITRCDTHIYDDSLTKDGNWNHHSSLSSYSDQQQQELIQVVFDNSQLPMSSISKGSNDEDEVEPSLPQLISSTSMQSTPGSSICSSNSSSSSSSHGSSSSSINAANKNRISTTGSDSTSDSGNDDQQPCCCASSEDELSSCCCALNDDDEEMEDDHHRHNNENDGIHMIETTIPIEESESLLSNAAPCQRSDPDVYGQRHPIESTTLITTKLEEFNALIQQQIEMYNTTTSSSTSSGSNSRFKITTTKSNEPKFMIAERVCPNITTSSFKLLFLRCECYDIDNTMKRYIRYWDKRVELFGNVRAYQPFSIETLEQYDHIKPYEMGLHIIQRSKSYNTTTNTNIDTPDERNILWFDASKLDPTKYTRDAGCRSFWYIFHAYLEDEQVQQRGMICINYSAHFTLKNRDPTFTRMCIGSLQGCLPIRISAFHGCHPPTLFRFAIRFFLLLIGERIRKRIIPHFGTEEHVIHILETKYNILRDSIPTDMGGNYILDGNDWLQQRRIAGL